MKPKTPSWIAIDSKTSEAVCKRCGEREKPNLPMLISEFKKWAEGFGNRHKHELKAEFVTAMPDAKTIEREVMADKKRPCLFGVAGPCFHPRCLEAHYARWIVDRREEQCEGCRGNGFILRDARPDPNPCRICYGSGLKYSPEIVRLAEEVINGK